MEPVHLNVLLNSFKGQHTTENSVIILANRANIYTIMDPVLKLASFLSLPKLMELFFQEAFVGIHANPVNSFTGTELAIIAALLPLFQKLREALYPESSVGILVSQPNIYTGMDLVLKIVPLL